MASACNKIIIVTFFLTALMASASFTIPPNPFSLQVSTRTLQKLRVLIGLRKTQKQFFNLSPAPAPAPASLTSPAPAPVRHVHSNTHPRRRNPRVGIIPVNRRGSGHGGRARRVLVAVVVSAGGVTSILCVIGLFLGCRKFRKQKKKSSSSSKTVIKVISDPVPDLFYLESLENALDPPPICDSKHDSDNDDQNFTSPNAKLIEEEGEGGDEQSKVMVNSLDFSGDGVGASVESESDDESFHSICNSQHSSNPRFSDASIGGDILEQPLSSTPPAPPPPPPPPAATGTALNFLATKKTLQSLTSSSSSTSCSMKPVSSSGSNQTPIPGPPLPPPVSGNPPPPPLQLTSTGKDGTPLPKLKPLHWDKVRAAPDRSMVWDKLRSSSFEFDEEMIESLFGYNLHNANEESKSKSPSPSKHVLEPKRLQNLTILAKAINATTEQVCRALIQGSGLNLQQLEVLIKMEPTKEEEAKLTSYKGELGSAETFVTSILMVPYAFSRIEAMLYRETFEDEVTHLRKTFSILEEACKELRSSRLFLKLLEAVLKTGNRMNVGTIRGGAKAFKLDALLKLADIKGTDGKTTLLHFVVQEIVRSEGIRVSESIIGKINQKSKRKNLENREEDYRNMGLDLVSGLSTELCNVKKTATIDFEVIASSVSNLSQGMSKLRRLVNEDLLGEDKYSGFVESMKYFLSDAEKHLNELEGDEQKVLKLVKEITEYFHGNLSKDEKNPLGIFVIVRDFLAMLDLVCRELRRSKGVVHSNPLAPFK